MHQRQLAPAAKHCHMEAAHVQNLLRRSESDTLDFKRDQYPFAGASDEEKSELLKDIVAFANAWKESDAYIVIGVPEKDGRALAPVGAPPLPDSDIQQFVGSKVNRPLLFHVQSVRYDSVELTIIQIAQRQDRPIFLKKKFGKLEPGVVYIRRGSSTDKADPDEVAEMGRDDVRASAATKISDSSMEFEHVIETREDDGMFGGLGAFGRKREPYDVETLRIYLCNTGASVAHCMKGEVRLPKQLLWDFAPQPIAIPKTLDDGEWDTFPVSNKLSPARSSIYQTPYPPDWHPVLPQERIEVYHLRVFPLQLMQHFDCELAWKAQADSSPARFGKIRYGEISVIDERS